MHNISTILHYLDKLEDEYRMALVEYYNELTPEAKFKICLLIVELLLYKYPALTLITNMFLSIKAKDLGVHYD